MLERSLRPKLSFQSAMALVRKRPADSDTTAAEREIALKLVVEEEARQSPTTKSWREPEPPPRLKCGLLQFSDVLTVVKTREIEVPTPFMLTRIASAMPAMINPYSIAVAADRSATKAKSKRFKTMISWRDRRDAPAFGDQPEPRT
jgi:hypothetical protein